MLSLDRSSSTSLYEQLYRQLRRSIADEEYPPGSRLPSIRALTSELHCSRNTVEAAYRMLVEEGYAEALPGSGHVVADNSRGRIAHLAPAGIEKTSETPSHAPNDELESERIKAARYDFTYRDQEPGTFPASIWKSLAAQALLDTGHMDADGYSDPAGEPSLRRQIARMVATRRGISCTEDQVIIENGTQQSVLSVLGLFDPARDVIAMEEPGYDAVRVVFDELGFKTVPCPVWQGENAFVRAARESGAKIAFVTPSSQFPTTKMMTKRMRRELLAWARETDGYLIEDDFCWEFCHDAPQLPALFALDKADRTIYLGTFSKSVSPALRVTYVVLPPYLAKKWHVVNKSTYPAVAALLQNVLARYLADNRSPRNLRKLQKKCRSKHEALASALRAELGNQAEVIDHGTGLHVLVSVPGNRSEQELIAAALERGVRVYGTAEYFMTEERPFGTCLLVGHSSIEADDIAPGVRELARAWFD